MGSPTYSGSVVNYTTDAAVTAGQIIRLGKRSLGVVTETVETADIGKIIAVQASGSGAHTIAKAAVAIAVGDPIYVTLGTAPAATNAVTAGLYFFGYACEAAASGDSTVLVELCEFAEEPPRAYSVTADATLTIADFLSASGACHVNGNTQSAALTLTVPLYSAVPAGARLSVMRTGTGTNAITLATGISLNTLDAADDFTSYINSGTKWRQTFTSIA